MVGKLERPSSYIRCYFHVNILFQEQEDTVNKEQGSQEDKQALIDMFVELVKIDQGYF